jgi:hypothetical protein
VRDALQGSFSGGGGFTYPPKASIAPSASDAFIAKINTNASGADSLIYSTYFGVNSNETGSGIAGRHRQRIRNGLFTSFGITVGGIIHTGSTPLTTSGGANNGNLQSPFVLKIADSAASSLQFQRRHYSVAEDGGSALLP